MAKISRPWLTDLLVAFAATTLSIILTFGTSALVDRGRQRKERKLTALMVMSNIESFARSLEETEANLAHIDSVALWLLSLPAEDMGKLDGMESGDPITDVFQVPILRHDKTAETIFSGNIDTWKNMGNFQFVDNVGACFSSMNWIEDYFNQAALEYRDSPERIQRDPEAYPGGTMTEKYLLDTRLRRQLASVHPLRVWLNYNIAVLRKNNLENMRLIGITEKEVQDFTNVRGKAVVSEEEEPDISDFVLPYPDPDSLAAKLPYRPHA